MRNFFFEEQHRTTVVGCFLYAIKGVQNCPAMLDEITS